jgi:hypothetical protein
MIRILLLDCAASIEQNLKAQGFDVESGAIGFCDGVKRLPSQIYEKDVFVYNPTFLGTRAAGNTHAILSPDQVRDDTPEYSLKHLQSRVESGATLLVFVNRLSDVLSVQRMAYSWIPFMPTIEFTSDKHVVANALDGYPDSRWRVMSPIVTKDDLVLPVLQKVVPPEAQDYPRDVFYLFWNGNLDALGVLIERGRGRLIVLPTFKSNAGVIESFLHNVAPEIYDARARTGLIDMFTSPKEEAGKAELHKSLSIGDEIKKRTETARVQLATGTREKFKVIESDETAKQVMVYYSEAARQPKVALFYLYKIVESIENKFGGEAAGMAAVGAETEWKSVKRLANESYRDARHAPKPADIVKPWNDAEIKKCFEDTEKVVMAYFATLFLAPK